MWNSNMYCGLLISMFCLNGCVDVSSDNQSDLDPNDWIGKPLTSFQQEYGQAEDIGSGVEVYSYEIGEEIYLVTVMKGEISGIKSAQKNGRTKPD